VQVNKIKNSITLISQRVADPFVGWIVIDEFEDLFIEYTGATMSTPVSRTNWQGFAGKLKRKFVPDYHFEAPPPSADILFVVARAPIDLSVIRAIPDLKKRFSKVVAFLIDGYFLEGYPGCTSDYDQIFVTNNVGKKHIEDNYGVKCSKRFSRQIDRYSWIRKTASFIPPSFDSTSSQRIQSLPVSPFATGQHKRAHGCERTRHALQGIAAKQNRLGVPHAD
jgi:hypothetical protein